MGKPCWGYPTASEDVHIILIPRVRGNIWHGILKKEKFHTYKLQLLHNFKKASDLSVEMCDRFLNNIKNNKIVISVWVFTCTAGEVNKLEILGQKRIPTGYPEANTNPRSSWWLWFIKILLSLCLINRTPLRRMGECWYNFIILDLGTSWRWVVSFTPLPLYPWGKSLRYPLDRVGPRASLDTVEKRKFACSYRESNTGHPVCTPSLYGRQYPGSWLLFMEYKYELIVQWIEEDIFKY
jgi:hypothetical protein